jgi:hypothetical protein
MTDGTHADGRDIFIWHDQATDVTQVLVQERNPNVTRLAGVLARKTITELANIGGNLNRLHDGQFCLATKHDMLELCTRHVVSFRHANVGTIERPRYEVEWFSFAFPVVSDLRVEPNERVLIDLLTALLPLVARGPSAPAAFKPQQLSEIQRRLKSNEPAERIAKTYNCEVDAILEIKRAMAA